MHQYDPLFYWNLHMEHNGFKMTQYAVAVLLVTTSIVLAFVQVYDIKDIASGTLMYIAQAFLLAGSIFGLDYYVKKISYEVKKSASKGDSQQQSSEHQNRQ